MKQNLAENLEDQLSNPKQNLAENSENQLSNMKQNLAENLGSLENQLKESVGNLESKLKENNKLLDSRLQEQITRIGNEMKDTVKHYYCQLDRKLMIVEKRLENQIESVDELVAEKFIKKKDILNKQLRESVVAVPGQTINPTESTIIAACNIHLSGGAKHKTFTSSIHRALLLTLYSLNSSNVRYVLCGMSYSYL